MTEPAPRFSIRPHGDRWSVILGDKLVLVAATRAEAQSVAAMAVEVMARSRARRRGERRSFAED
jgi:hypothetical protein